MKYSVQIQIHFRLSLKDVLFLMLFIYNHANMQDLKKLHGHVSKAELGFPIKPFKDVEASTVLKRPPMIIDYLDGISETEDIAFSDQNKDVQFKNWGQDGYPKRSQTIKPTITDIGLCQSFNSKLEQDVFEPQTVMNYAEIFHHGRDYGQIMPASMKSYSFIIDSQRRFNSRYGWKIGGVPIVSDTQVIAKYVP